MVPCAKDHIGVFVLIVVLKHIDFLMLQIIRDLLLKKYAVNLEEYPVLSVQGIIHSNLIFYMKVMLSELLLEVLKLAAVEQNYIILKFFSQLLLLSKKECF